MKLNEIYSVGTGIVITEKKNEKNLFKEKRGTLKKLIKE